VLLKEVSATCEKINESKVSVRVRIVATFLKKTWGKDVLIQFWEPGVGEVDQHTAPMNTLYKLLLVINQPQLNVRWISKAFWFVNMFLKHVN